ncbi:Tn7 transposase TnsA N-terminal domain-containing protein [Methylomonas sp. EFPC1]|uniref:TnsA endonuclease N-terminal domain-containing protein n=1 Tax=Methylomonas sp. EFPC1 TaxID=2812647 RepID=UPI0019676BDF|nr:TnsA endonuclease N-terminal domain-containing protein [Methylomonas sp. EFPC1]QSB01418.1 Tn7 transposase TnsA N-terminal domain-containing protein [Methylomonas sp. EFPC1]
MVRRNNSNSEITIQKWIKDGRGAGSGKDYKPWLTVRDVSSEGRSHRIFGHKTQRTHHLLSDLELAVFLLLEWHPETEDIREQFPLRLEDTQALAMDAIISHPAYQGVTQIMTSDFLVTTGNHQQPKFALQAKYSESLQDTRTIEKLELERRYWHQKSIPWFLFAKRRAKLSRVLGKRALKSFHPRLFNVRFFAGESWSVTNGRYCRNQTASSSRERDYQFTGYRL